MRKRLFVVLVLLFTGCVQHQEEIKETRALLGTTVTITVMSADPAAARNAINLAFSEIERIEMLLSNYRNTSEVSKLNREGKIENASPDLIVNLEMADYYSNLSGGAFDITVQPILDLYGRTYNIEGRPPTEEEIGEARELIDYRNIRVDGRNVRFAKDGMSVTLGGIATGYAVDRAVEVLKDNGIEHALINAGGDIRALGSKDSLPWTIALQDPRNKTNYVTMMRLNNQSVTTSGDYERYFVEKKVHHIIDPKTGYSAMGVISVTIVADEAIDADALATAVFVLGPEEGLALVENLTNIEGLLITENKTLIRSSGFPKYEAN
ncbi:MAG: FAD:protein FMN transferase [Candidatus Altiarchaeota archaeon]